MGGMGLEWWYLDSKKKKNHFLHLFGNQAQRKETLIICKGHHKSFNSYRRKCLCPFEAS